MRGTRLWLVAAFAMLMVYAAPSEAQISAENFKIDDTKPYVYIKFDHIGDRKPVRDRESTKGLWLRLVNNCRLPIELSVLDPGTGDPGAIVKYEVVATGGRFAPDSEQRKKMPYGYWADIGTLVTIPPNGDFLFSVPAESVTKQWYVRVRFDFVLPASKSRNFQPSGNYEPNSVVDFDWYIIPEQYRTSSVQSDRPPSIDNRTKPSGDTLVHRSGHSDSAK